MFARARRSQMRTTSTIGLAVTIAVCVGCSSEPSPTATPPPPEPTAPAETPAVTETPEVLTQPSSQETTPTDADEATPKVTIKTGPVPVDAQGRLDLTFDDLAFEMEKGDDFERSMLTDRINGFHQQEVRLRGFIRPSFRQSGIEKFIFVRDNKECCFGPGAALYDCVLVRLKKGSKADFTVRPVTVTGTLSIKEYEGPAGNTLAIFRMKNGKIE